MNREELQAALLEAEKAVLILKLDRMLAQIRDHALDSISENMHLIDMQGKVEFKNHENFLESILESYMDNEMF
jgi:hypothetical protein